jgi:hypothetical protein
MRFIGITVLPEYLQSESVDSVLDNVIERAGATAVATSPYVMTLADEETGSREPPADAGAGKVRLLDRPLWGKRELWVKTSPSFSPNQSLYDGLVYQPPSTDALTEQDGAIVQQFVERAKSRGLEVYFQVQAAIPPGYRVQFGGPVEADLPRLPDGRIPTKRVANNASLASPDVLAYQQALIRDLYQAYPDIDGIRFDWPEYPPYLLDSVFLDFGEHVQRWAEQHGWPNFTLLREDAKRLYNQWHGGLTDADLRAVLAGDGGRGALLQTLIRHPFITNMLALKADLSRNLLESLKATMDEVSGGHWKLTPSAFPPPWSQVSGMDFRNNSSLCDAISVKLYGMHWAMILRFYGDQLMAANPSLDSQLLSRALVRLLDIDEEADQLPDLKDYRYPDPDQSHPIGRSAQIRKIERAQRDAGLTPIHVLAHGYGPLDDFRSRIETACRASEHGFWVNRYGYLSDAKLDAIGAIAGEAR